MREFEHTTLEEETDGELARMEERWAEEGFPDGRPSFHDGKAGRLTNEQRILSRKFNDFLLDRYMAEEKITVKELARCYGMARSTVFDRLASARRLRRLQKAQG